MVTDILDALNAGVSAHETRIPREFTTAISVQFALVKRRATYTEMHNHYNHKS